MSSEQEKREQSGLEEPMLEGVETQEDERIFVASQWQLMRWRFMRHKLAVISMGIIALLYVIAIFAEFISPYDPVVFSRRHVLVPPQAIHFWDAEGKFHLRPFVYGLKSERDPETLRRLYQEDPSKIYPIHFLVRSTPYKFWNLFKTDLHFFGLEEVSKGTLFLLGTDNLGRDMLSRIIYGARVSLSVGLVGVTLSLFLGVLLGGISGYYGGLIDLIIQRVIEVLRSVPSIPLWMGLAAAVPKDAPVVQVYFMITVILSLIGWTGMARVVRGKFLSLREEDFVMAAKFAGAGELRIILLHMVPSFLSHIIASLTLAIPGMILAETALSFLGLGLRPPAISWGVLLQAAQNVSTIALAPWQLLPVLAVIITILAFNFMGDGLRDAADPYSNI
jgi:peptide/nickel transport system permease protein